MLAELHVRNFAVIRDVRIEFGEGFNVLTGETGAGKSLLIDALLLFMGRGAADVVRSGEENAVVEALFTADDALRREIEEAGTDEFVAFRKVVGRTGKSRQYVNGGFVGQARMREILGRFLHVYGQSEARELYEPAYHAELLDFFCDATETADALKTAIREARTIRNELKTLREQDARRAHEMDLLAYQVAEISDAGLDRDDEEEVLGLRRSTLLGRDKIIRNLGEAYELLYGGEGAAFDVIGRAEKLLAETNSDDPVIAGGLRELRAAAETIRSQAYEFRHFTESLDTGESLDEIEARLDVLYRLKKKYGGSIPAVRAYLREAEAKLAALSTSETRERELSARMDDARRRVTALDDELRTKRRNKIAAMREQVVAELRDLGMPKAVFDITLTQGAPADAEEMPLRGGDAVEFLFSAHAGEPPRPLSRIASGGELSRVMLALKNVIPKERAMAVVFDEVDAGIGGKTAEMVGKKLQEIAGRHQVICITHLPQVAVWGVRHVRVEKTEADGRPEVAVRPLGRDERVAEITRMLGGDPGSKGMEYAKELLERVC